MTSPWIREGILPIDNVYYYDNGRTMDAVTRHGQQEDPEPFSEGLGKRKRNTRMTLQVNSVTPVKQAVEMAKANIQRKKRKLNGGGSKRKWLKRRRV